ncbi:related to CYC2 - cytochrome-c mitochondrial import factor [Ustilago trichophora]|uniref:Related to CYC2 - cytochrome-c mitochondrial import factor n=1 Tax=Ustilago trichophora TaxID=86804 RepID=A0A5C3DPX0_9BASI|nr:related to CYC2 - cytochrome-c mitochondrial import factor [Ustilago trichophora]
MRLSSRVMRRSGNSSLTAPFPCAPTKRTLHTSFRRNEQQAPSTSSGSGSSSSGPSKKAPLSITNILIATVTIVVATPYALDLYGTVSGSKPSRSSSSFSSSSSIPGKLEPYTHHPLPLSTSSYYPDPSTASAHKLLQIALPSSPAGSADADLKKKLRIRSIYIKEPSLVIERAYTPLYDTLPGTNSTALIGASKEQKQVLDLIVKRYPDGELGRMLHRARPNPTVPQLEVRGPVDTWSLERDSAEGGGNVPHRIVMVVGGTGVTPAYQLLTNLFGRPNAIPARVGGDVPKIDVLYATPDVQNALLLPQLYALAEANKDKVNITLFAENLPSPSTLTSADMAALGQLTATCPTTSTRSWIPFFNKNSSTNAKLELTSLMGSTKIPVFESRITQQHLEKTLAQQKASERQGERTLVLVCGPDAMVDALAGPKSRDGQTQGRLSGMLGRIGLRQEDVFKL